MNTTILGSGLSGLSAAYYLLQRNKNPITVIEATNRVGGWIKSNTQSDGVIFEQGPRTVRPKGIPGANTLSLIEDLKLTDKIKPISSSHPAATRRMVLANQELHLLPTSLKGLFRRQKPFSKPLIRLLMNDLVTPAQIARDESIYDFVSRRFGKEVGDYLISPMICGICGGNAKEISVKFLMESLFDKEQKHGSIAKGILASLFESRSKEVQVSCPLHQRSVNEHWSVYTFDGGIEILPQRLEEVCRSEGVDFQMNTKCTGLEFGDCATVHLSNDTSIASDYVVSSIPAEDLSNLTQHQHPQLAALLRKIKTVSLAVVNLQYNQKLLTDDQQGFGFLVCPDENRPILGVIYDSCCFSYEDKTVLTVMLGGHWFYKYFTDATRGEEFLNVALQQIGDILKIDKRPDNYQVNILKNAIPQYTVGHKENLEHINSYIVENKLKLSLCGCSYHGVGINDVILSARNVVDKIEV